MLGLLGLSTFWFWENPSGKKKYVVKRFMKKIKLVSGCKGYFSNESILVLVNEKRPLRRRISADGQARHSFL